MKKLLVAFALLTLPVLAYAACTTHTVFIKGQMVMCTTCCFNGNCTTTCM